jgi:predicted RecB family nuclease
MHNKMSYWIAGFGKPAADFCIAVPVKLDNNASRNPQQQYVTSVITGNTEKMETKKVLKTCKKGHRFYKSSDCPVCPVCEKECKTQNSFLTLMAAPARRALENHAITTLEQLSELSEEEVLGFHGMGKSTIPKLKMLLAEKKLTFRQT